MVAGIRTIAANPGRIFAVGDIHGCIREVQILVDFLRANVGITDSDLIVFVGDYIDRGPGSRDVIDLMLQIRREWPRTVFLKGNHEDMLLGFLGLGGSAGEVYLANGGNAFFQSYNISPFGPLSEIIEQLPKDHLEFFQGLDLGVCVGDFVLVHAGVSPYRTLEQQDPADLMWIRREFIDGEHILGKTVVFGHTAFHDIFVDLPYKIGIDTGAIYGNQLSIVELQSGDLFQVEVGDSTVKVSSVPELARSVE